MSFFHSRESTYIPYYEKEAVGVRVKCSYLLYKGQQYRHSQKRVELRNGRKKGCKTLPQREEKGSLDSKGLLWL